MYLRERSAVFWILLFLYVVGQWVFNRLQFGLVFFIVAAIVFIFVNLNRGGSRKGLSAYSVFNPGGQRLLGTQTVEEYERMLRGFGTLE